MSAYLKGSSFLVNPATGAMVVKDGYQMTTSNSVLTFSDGTVISTAPVSRQVVQRSATFVAGVTGAMTNGVGLYSPAAAVLPGEPLSGPKDIVIEIQGDFGNTGTTITAGDTCVLRILLELNLVGGTNVNCPSQYIPASATLCNVFPAGLGTQTFTQAFPWSLEEGQQLSGITVQYNLVGPATTSTNVLAIGASSVKIYGSS